ncbi:hypothetical protein GCM10009788_22470 [Nocardioides humi]|uniref:Immunity protein Imm1 n=1 Tax=Nocardioides humi TaxID=449461 RepID=A0ABN2AFH7_9ACTN
MSLTYAVPSTSPVGIRRPTLVRKSRQPLPVPEMTLAEPSLSTGVQRDRLLVHFVASLRDIVVSSTDIDADLARAEVALELLDALLTDDHPTPQLSRGPSGALTIEWLVDGCVLVIDVVSPSDVRLWAEDAAGSDVFDYELNRNWEPSDGAIREARDFLEALAKGVRHRVQLRGL